MPQSALASLAARGRENASSALAGLGRLPDGVSIGQFLSGFAAVGELDPYHYIPEAAAAVVRRLEAQMGAAATRAFLRAALGEGIAALVASGDLNGLPPRIVHHHSKQLQRIVDAIATDADWFTLESDLFLKDLGLVTLRLYAAAAQLLDTRCGVPRSIVFREGILAAPRLFGKLRRLGGFKPFVQIHTHLSNLADFTEEGWKECYRCCADLYGVRPDLLGMFGSSWFYDPELDVISPRLAYLRDCPREGGANLFFVEAGGSAIGNATATSPSRRQLYEDGKYLPKSYMLVWGRDAQIDWARRNPGGAI